MEMASFVGNVPLLGNDQTKTSPNVLFIIADDWGAHASAYGTPWIATPGFDRVAKEGLLFPNAFTPMAKCAPSRATILTGRYPWQLEEAGNHMAFFPPKFKSWPETLTEQNWFVGITGKGWGPGIAKDANGVNREMTGLRFDKRTAKSPTKGIANNDYAKNFEDFLDAAPSNKPWSFWCGMQEPHRGYEYESGVKSGKKRIDIDRVPKYWPDNEVTRNDMLDYALEVEHVDLHVTSMLAELDRRGLRESTLVIITADHGMPFPRCKGYAYYDSNHVPLAIRWPKGIPVGGRVITDFVDFTDLAATILDVAGLTSDVAGMQPISGKSWRPIFESKANGQVLPERDYALVCKERTDVGRPNDWGYPIRGIIRDRFLYLHNYEPSRWPAGNPETGYLDTDASPTKTLILAQGRKDRNDAFWQLCFGMRDEEELYDLGSDPDCLVNLAFNAKHAQQKAKMRSQMESRLRSDGDPRQFGQGHVFDQYKPTNNAGFYEKWKRGEKVNAGWVDPTDFENEPIEPTRK
jgi:N-sulfoglucosamine sulfohydrolase